MDSNNKRLLVTVQIELNKCAADPQEVEDAIRYSYEISSKHTAAMNVFLLRTARASTWELKSVKVEAR